jgi:hypothetical protein
VIQLDPCLSHYATLLAENGTPLPVGTLRICHPLILNTKDPLRPILVEPGGEEHANWKLARARAHLAGLEQRGDWKEAILAHTTFYRLAALEKYAPALDDKRYWQVVAFVWVEDESPSASRSQRWLRVLESPRPGHSAMMTGEELRKLGGLPTVVRIFRGFDYRGGRFGLSWTLRRDVADRFAGSGSRLAPANVAEGEINREAIIALLLGKDEAEVVANPADVRM